MATIKEMLAIAKDAGASDLHITVGVPPKMRVNGQLITMDFERLLPPDCLLYTSIISFVERHCSALEVIE